MTINSQTKLYSNMSESEKREAAKLLFELAAESESENSSEFERKNANAFTYLKIAHTTELKEIGFKTLEELLNKNYNFLMIKDHRNRTIGTAAFQNYLDSIHSFSLYVTKAERRKGYGTKLIDSLLYVAYEKGIEKVRLGKGTNEIMGRIISNLPYKNHGFPIEIKENGWVHIPKYSEELAEAK